MSPLSVPDFSIIGVRIYMLWQILQSVQIKEKPETLATRISEMAVAIFFKFRM